MAAWTTARSASVSMGPACIIPPGVIRKHEEPLLVYDTESVEQGDTGKSASA